jgi:hypothetical protein
MAGSSRCEACGSWEGALPSINGGDGYLEFITPRECSPGAPGVTRAATVRISFGGSRAPHATAIHYTVDGCAESTGGVIATQEGFTITRAERAGSSTYRGAANVTTLPPVVVPSANAIKRDATVSQAC